MLSFIAPKTKNGFHGSANWHHVDTSPSFSFINFSLTLEDLNASVVCFLLFSGWPEQLITMTSNAGLLNKYRSILIASSKCSIAVLRNQNTQAQLWTRPSNKDFLKCSSRIGPNG